MTKFYVDENRVHPAEYYDLRAKGIYAEKIVFDNSGNTIKSLSLSEALKLNKLRLKRKMLLEAFDTYKINVYYGIEIETGEQHQNLMAWYQKLKELDEEALENVPARIKYYLGGLKE